MALRDRFDKIISYFDTDDVSDTEENIITPTPQETPVVSSDSTEFEQPRSNRPVAPKTKPVHSRPVVQTPPVERPATPSYDTYTPIYREERPVRETSSPRLPERPHAPTTRPNQSTVKSSAQQTTPAAVAGQTQIAIKHPLRYEDASAIADAFILGQCILVDFEYMQDAQARRCIDFLTGACLVAKGSLQKVGATMFLLTPEGVVVTMEDVLPQQRGQEATYDYDMKRR